MKPDSGQRIQLIRLGETDFGIHGAGIAVHVDNTTGIASFQLVVAGGKVRQVAPQLKPLQVVAAVVKTMSVKELIELFEAEDLCTEQPTLQVVQA